jgi:hypothetical protein
VCRDAEFIGGGLGLESLVRYNRCVQANVTALPRPLEPQRSLRLRGGTTYWHWLEYDSVALATLFTGIGLVALLNCLWD